MEFPLKEISGSEENTKKIADEFAKLLKPGDVVCLNGDLGSGKTFFVKAVCVNFGINEVNSPTFAIVNEYFGKKKIYHFDFYRLKNEEELMEIGFYEYLNDTEAITFIEWSDKFPDILPQHRFDVNIKTKNENSREIEIIRL